MTDFISHSKVKSLFSKQSKIYQHNFKDSKMQFSCIINHEEFVDNWHQLVNN